MGGGGGLRRAALLMLGASVLAAGCTGLAPVASDVAPPASPADERGALGWSESLPPLVAGLAPAPDLVPLHVAVSEPWARPLRPLAANASLPAGVEPVWAVGIEGDDARVVLVDGRPYVARWSSEEAHHHHGPVEPHTHDGPPAPPPPRRPRADAGTLDPDERRPTAVRVAASGLHVLAAQPGGATMRVLARPEAPHDRDVPVLVVQDASGAVRFVPEDVELRPGARLLLHLQAAQPVEVRERAYHALLPGQKGSGATFVPVDEGLYRAVAYAPLLTGDVAMGSATALVDFERPSAFQAIGPTSGRFLQGEAPAPAPRDERRLGFEAAHPVERLTVWFNATSGAPVPASVVVAVEREGEVLAQASSLQTGEIVMEELAAGRYVLVVRPEHGALVAFEAQGEMRYRLPVPDAVRAG